MAPVIRLPFHFRLVSSRPRLIQRYDTIQECIPFLFVTFQMHPSQLVSLPFLDFSKTVRDPTRCDFAHVQAFFENVQDLRMGQPGLTGQLPNCPPSISNNVATELNSASVALGRPGRGWFVTFCHPARKAWTHLATVLYSNAAIPQTYTNPR